MRRVFIGLSTIVAITILIANALAVHGVGKPQDDAAPGQLTIIDKDGKAGQLCPLKGTKVDVEIEGFGANVTVSQTFVNPSKSPIEAIYTFPLPENAAVDRMRMEIGDRVVIGAIKKRDEARQIYEAAKNAGKVASLLDQERPNIFTQSVSNIMPSATVKIVISYVQVLKYDSGKFEFVFPMVVGPRFVDGNTRDSNKISPPITQKGARTGATIDVNVYVRAGMAIQSVESVLHKIDVQAAGREGTVVRRGQTSWSLADLGANEMRVQLTSLDEIPNRDFIIRYGVAGNQVKSTLLSTNDPKRGGFFTLIMMPPATVTSSQVVPKEIIFVMDQSGSQNGFPIEKSIELCRKLIDNLNPSDTFNVIGFNNKTYFLWKSSQANSPRARAEAIGFLEQMRANGGTQLDQAVVAALEPPTNPARPRIVVFNTDGLAGSEPIILNAIRKYRQNARVFTFGIGNSVNRYLIDAMSQEGKGGCEVVTLADKSDLSVERFYQRINSPVMTNVQVEFDGVQVLDVYPKLVPDVFSNTPVVVYGRYNGAQKGTVRLSGMTVEGQWTDEIPIQFSNAVSNDSALPSLWARNRIKEIETDAYIQGALNGGQKNAPAEIITQVALDYGLMSQYTSFVAVEEKVVNQNGVPTTVYVPVELADGVTYDGLGLKAGETGQTRGRAVTNSLGAPSPGGIGGGGFGGSAGASGAPPPSQAAQKPLRDNAGRRELEKKDEKSNATKANEAREQVYQQKVEIQLQKVKSGQVKIQIWLIAIEPKILEKISKLGFVIRERGISQPVLFGSGDAEKVRELAQLGEVLRIKLYK